MGRVELFLRWAAMAGVVLVIWDVAILGVVAIVRFWVA